MGGKILEQTSEISQAVGHFSKGRHKSCILCGLSSFREHNGRNHSPLAWGGERQWECPDGGQRFPVMHDPWYASSLSQRNELRVAFIQYPF